MARHAFSAKIVVIRNVLDVKEKINAKKERLNTPLNTPPSLNVRVLNVVREYVRLAGRTRTVVQG